MWPSCRAVPSRASAIARIAAAIVSSSLFSAASAATSCDEARANACWAETTLARSSLSSMRNETASLSKLSGSRPEVRASSASSLRKRDRS